MATKKLACEELAHYLEGHYRADVNLIEGKSYASQAKRLRAEGRELKQYRRLLADLCCGVDTKERDAANKLHDLSDRIQKARKAK